ncbi:MFS transporter [Nakamurella sp. DB0629]|uniref:MFS transporter n=2 Tax=Nakamurella aerolata TaxID=1656892 RepID=A0A849AEJ3_9ACTN|nr:MFS transporter [Nakamurella aerolata]NNG37631.1 MFS transporter [Nakamurella aerolata]
MCGALFLDALDISMVGVALPSIGGDLGMTPTSLQWIVSGYVLGYGGLLLLGGRAADLFGRRRMFLAAVTVFGVASVISAMLSDPTAIIALRFIKGVSAGFTVPAGMSIITTTFAEGPARNKALSIYTVAGASGFSLGLVFGGLLTEIGWRATLLFPGPVALLIVLAGWRLIPRTTGTDRARGALDLPGALTSTGALLALVLGVVQAPHRGWTDPLVLVLLVGAAALAVGFVLIERRHRQPLVRLGILQSRPLVHANLVGAIMFGSYAAFQFLVTLYLQDALGWSPLQMALGFLPAGILVALSAGAMDRVLDRFPTQLLIAIGLTAFAVGYALFLSVRPGQNYLSFLLPTMLLLGLGFALCFPSINAQATAGVVDDEQGLASGLVNTCVQVGGAIMMAVVTAIIGTGTATSGQLLPGMGTAIVVITVLTTAGLIGTVWVAAKLLRSRKAASVAAAPAGATGAPGEFTADENATDAPVAARVTD